MTPSPQDKLRLWPGVLIVALQWLARFVVPVVVPEAATFGVLSGLVGGLAILGWWVFFSRAPRSERWFAVAVIVVALAAAPYILHVSIATAMMGLMFYVYAVPAVCLALVGWALVSRRLAPGPRRVAMVGAILPACCVWALLRSEGISEAGSEFAWRWSQTPEQRLLARSEPEPPPPIAPTQQPQAAETPEAPGPATSEAPAAPESPMTSAAWPGFRGRDRDSVVSGVHIDPDWVASPPEVLWRQAVGPGWSSFAVQGNLIYTQEQRGEDELVSCYDLTTGDPVWRHRDATRFWEANAGAGPRGTPTLSGGRVYSLGATGVLNALDAGAGSSIWSRDAAADTDASLPGWGFSGSPLVVEDTVIVAVSGAIAAYDAANGELRWRGPASGEGYSSPHLAVIDEVQQILVLNGGGVVGLSPDDGTQLWAHAWSGYPIVQPALVPGGGILFGVDSNSGTRRLAVSRGPEGWTAEERWTSRSLKPYFNDFVIHKGHAYGFDGSILASVDIEDGSRKWKGGRYGNGQLLLLSDQDLLLVLSERGELALVSATPDQFSELARIPAIEGKTWNHPVLVGDLLLVRNDREMAAFRLPLAGERGKG